MKANVSKCASLAVRASSGKVFDHKLALSSEPIPYIGTSTFRFFGAPISIHSSSNQTREALRQKLQSLLESVDNTLLSRQQKFLLYIQSWDLPTPVMRPIHIGVPRHLAQVHSPATDHLLLEEVEWPSQNGGPQQVIPAQSQRWSGLARTHHCLQEGACCQGC